MLFDLAEDPNEHHNRIDDPLCHDIHGHLDARLTQEIMRSISLSHEDRRVYTADLSGDPAFGKEGWQRPYPRPLAGADGV